MPGLLPPTPNPSGRNSKEFTTPPVDGSLTAEQIFDFHAKNSPNFDVFTFWDAEKKAIHRIKWPEVQLATHRVAESIRALRLPMRTAGKPTQIGILIVRDTISYFTILHGIIRAGYSPFPISPRNSPAAVARLCELTHVTHMIVSEDPSMQGLADASIKTLENDGKGTVTKLPALYYDELYAPKTDADKIVPAVFRDLDDVALTLHSSGSTSFPKPIYLSHRVMLEWPRIPHFTEKDITGENAFGALPIFHSFGVLNSLMRAVNGSILGVFPPSRTPSPPTPDEFIDLVPKLNLDVLLSVPSFLELFAQKPQYVELLKRCKLVIYAGGPLSKVVGDQLVAEGVNLLSGYGITEIGVVNQIPKDIIPTEWEWFRFSKHLNVHLDPQDDDPNLFELQLLPGPNHTPAVKNGKVKGQDGYLTSDLVYRNPKNHEQFRIHGRIDDQIMMSNGEKTNPGPIEATINRDPLVSGSVMFGRGKPSSGIIIAPAPSVKLDITDKEAVQKYIDSIWPSIKLANDYAPAHSRLFREMIIIATPDKPFTFTAKGSIRKSAVVAEYKDEIEAQYAAQENASGADVAAPKEWTEENVASFVREIIHTVMENKVTDDQDFFQHGADSLQSTVIINTLINSLKAAGKDTSAIPDDFVYQFPTVTQAAAEIYAIGGTGAGASDRVAKKKAEIDALIEKYTANLPRHTPSAPAPNGEVFVMTGSTGGLGSVVLAQLVAKPNVKKIYALNRKGSGKTLKQRQVQALTDRGYSGSIASSEKVVLVETDSSLPGLGVQPAILEEMRKSTTSILHLAWRVDFKLALSSFEPLITNLRDLIELSLSSPLPEPPRIVFASSVGVYSNWKAGALALEEPITDANIVVGQGYGESKWVAERILDKVANTTPIKPTIVRIGQICGGINGSWNTSEWLPSVVRSGEVVGALPSNPTQEIAWLPLASAAAAIIDFAKSQSLYVHLAHPEATMWNNVFDGLSEALNVPLINYGEWVDRLEKDLKDESRTQVQIATNNPALLLIDLFRLSAAAATGKAKTDNGQPKLDTVEALKASPALRPENLKQLNKDDAKRWVSYWRSVDFLKTKAQ